MALRKRQFQSPLKAKLNIPLECQDSSEFGKLDSEQFYLIEKGALDLVLIENASELMRRVMMEPGNIEKILNLFSKTYEGCSVLPSESFPIYTEGADSWQNTGTKEEYTKSVNYMRKIYKKEITKKGVKCVYAVFALKVENDGSGHYGSFFISKNSDKVRIFDSMQSSENGSAYSVFFSKLAEDIFGVKAVYDKNFNHLTSLQLTGGFSANPPLMLMYQANPPLSESDKLKIRLQSTESQNHFCYMWSIWSLHLIMLGKDPREIALEISQKNIDPLTVIKRYIWALFNYRDLRLIDQIPEKYKEFFTYHWPAIWSNDPLRTLKQNTFFTRYEIPLDNCQNLTDCLKLSYEQLKIITTQNITPLTPPTAELIECMRLKK